MKIPSPTSQQLPTPSLWPRDKLGVMAVAEQWYDPSRVAIDLTAIQALPAGFVSPPPVGSTNLETATGAFQDAAIYALVLNATNHRFWSLDESGQFELYRHNGHEGALAMTTAFEQAWNQPDGALQRALQDNVPLELSDIRDLWGNIPGPEERLAILNEVLLSPQLAAFGERATAVAEGREPGGFDTGFAADLADAFPLTFGDPVLKKAQLATSAVWRGAVGRGLPVGCDLTAFADYEIPNVLRSLGVLTYDPDLAARIDRHEILLQGGPDENALRAASILAIESLAQAQGVSVADVDYAIWLRRNEPTTPFHLTLTTAY